MERFAIPIIIIMHETMQFDCQFMNHDTECLFFLLCFRYENETVNGIVGAQVMSKILMTNKTLTDLCLKCGFKFSFMQTHRNVIHIDHCFVNR